MSYPVLHGFRPVRSRHVSRQEDLLAWDAWRRARELTRTGAVTSAGEEETARAQLLDGMRMATGKWVGSRGHEVDDFTHRDLDRMQLYHEREPATLAERNDLFGSLATRIFTERMYPEGSEPPDSIIHVTSTGWVLPSPAQFLIAARGWHARTQAYHAYGAGCAGAFHAIRMAMGIGPSRLGARRWSVDVAHTELMSVHLTLADLRESHGAKVLASAYGDGLIRFTVGDAAPGKDHFRIETMRDALLPDSLTGVTTRLGTSAIELRGDGTLNVHLARTLKKFVAALFDGAGLSFERDGKDVLLAGYFGPPSSLEAARFRLGFEQRQVQPSLDVAFELGSMASASVPHAWARILADPRVPAGTRILSLAVGPGLVLAGSLMIKESGRASAPT